MKIFLENLEIVEYLNRNKNFKYDLREFTKVSKDIKFHFHKIYQASYRRLSSNIQPYLYVCTRFFPILQNRKGCSCYIQILQMF